MKNAKVVIGANFGDEGKGLMTDYFSSQSDSSLVVCHNGGSQKGHTVVTPEGVRHVFHHFGAGSFCGADTYLSEDFIVNPIIFNKELVELQRKNIDIECFINKNCKLTTPFDMIINQIVEEYRGELKHGSCGLGIFETIKRDEIAPIRIGEFYNFSKRHKEIELNIIFDLMFKRFESLNIDKLPLKWISTLASKNAIIQKYIEDFNKMMCEIYLCGDNILDKYENVIFEGGQGLLLDQNNLEYMPHLTPSNTGMVNPLKIIGDRKCDLEVCYVTRTYMTRHGAGRFDTECNKSEIASGLIDLTNTPNEFQDTLRYGKLDIDKLKERIYNDIGSTKCKLSLAITHLNTTDTNLITANGKMGILKFLNKDFDKYYKSYGMTREDVI